VIFWPTEAVTLLERVHGFLVVILNVSPPVLDLWACLEPSTVTISLLCSVSGGP